MTRICSIVFGGLKTGIKFVNGDFLTEQSFKHTFRLAQLQDQFNAHSEFKQLPLYEYGKAAQEFLKEHHFEVKFNDYTQVLNEKMSESEAKEFIRLLKKSKEVKFKYYKKKDGSVRTARGTLDPETIRKGMTAAGIEKSAYDRKVPNTIIIYWDLDRKMFRCFRKDNFIKIIR